MKKIFLILSVLLFTSCATRTYVIDAIVLRGECDGRAVEVVIQLDEEFMFDKGFYFEPICTEVGSYKKHMKP